jgi:hypothetical protein
MCLCGAVAFPLLVRDTDVEHSSVWQFYPELVGVDTIPSQLHKIAAYFDSFAIVSSARISFVAQRIEPQSLLLGDQQLGSTPVVITAWQDVSLCTLGPWSWIATVPVCA